MNDIAKTEPPLVENPLDDLESPVHDLKMLTELMWTEQERIALLHNLPDEFIWLLGQVHGKALFIHKILHAKWDRFSEQAKAANVVTVRPR